MRWVLLLGLLVLVGCSSNPPIADAHLHFNWNQKENTSPERAAQILKDNNVKLAVISSIPPKLALEVKQHAPDIVLPMFTPYLTPIHRKMWFSRPEVVTEAREALASENYYALGEVHLIPGLGPSKKNPIFVSLIELADEFNVPFLIHTDASSYKYLEPVCKKHHNVTFVWAHAGGILPPSDVDQLLESCSNVWVDLSARDPWRYVNSPITNDQGQLFPDWAALVINHPDRFMIGSDALWPVTQMHNWFGEDTGWQRMSEFYDFHKTWISYLPEDVQEKVYLSNANAVYRQ